MKVRIVGEGQLTSAAQEYLTVGKIYDAEAYPDDDSLANIEDNKGDTIIIRVGDSCAHIWDGDNGLRWEVVDDN